MLSSENRGIRTALHNSLNKLRHVEQIANSPSTAIRGSRQCRNRNSSKNLIQSQLFWNRMRLVFPLCRLHVFTRDTWGLVYFQPSKNAILAIKVRVQKALERTVGRFLLKILTERAPLTSQIAWRVKARLWFYEGAEGAFILYQFHNPCTAQKKFVMPGRELMLERRWRCSLKSFRSTSS
jgi:hypothetical protein